MRRPLHSPALLTLSLAFRIRIVTLTNQVTSSHDVKYDGFLYICEYTSM
jgi:hypothetical protein